jgi:lincosamide nucleotidyltransferase A/C/D/E
MAVRLPSVGAGGSINRLMDAAEVLRVLDALSAAGVRAGVTGGWGIDALLRRQTRQHGDVDLGVPSDSVDAAIEALRGLGYSVTADERPARVVLESATRKVDLHPIVMLASGAGVQTGFDGQTFEYTAGSLEVEGEIGGRIVRCGSPELQLTFHRGYQPREHDRLDMAALADAFGLTLEPPYSG